MVNNEETVRIVKDVLTERLSMQSLIDTQIDFVEDFDGEPIVRVTARLKEPIHESELLFQAADEIRDRLLSQGDKRFVFVQQASSGFGRDDQADEESAEGDLQ
jgi:ribosomal 50S subunit-associated protein YjgA (DUF615 family)